MHLHFEKNNNAKCDCNILSLSWMGKVPDESPEVKIIICQSGVDDVKLYDNVATDDRTRLITIIINLKYINIPINFFMIIVYLPYRVRSHSR